MIEIEVMITVTNLYFCDIAGFGTLCCESSYVVSFSSIHIIPSVSFIRNPYNSSHSHLICAISLQLS
jgi:hypothetical protein